MAKPKVAKPKVSDLLNLLSGKTFDECNKLLDRIENLTKDDDVDDSEDDDSSPEDEPEDDDSDSPEDDEPEDDDSEDDDSEDDDSDFLKLQKENDSLKKQIKKLQEKNKHQSLDDDDDKSLQEQQNDIIQKLFG